jgi:ABC-2 type transport system ATP-binding protein
MNPSVNPSASDDGIIEIAGVKKHYGAIRAVDGVRLTIRRGSCFGLLGPNGAGKTTLIEIVEDIIRPTAGTIRYKGKLRTADFRQEIGIMFQQTALLSFLTVAETLQTFQRLYNLTESAERLIDLCHLGEVRNRFNDKISGGQKQRLLLALALLNRPELVFLDEPSTGLDPQARRNLWNIIETVKSQGRTLVLTTHYMEEAENLCDDIAIMDKGRVIARGAPDELIRLHCKRATVTLPGKDINRLPDQLKATVRRQGDRAHIRTEQVNTVVGQLLDRGIDMNGVNVKTPTLEDVFLKLTGRSLRE